MAELFSLQHQTIPVSELKSLFLVVILKENTNERNIYE